MPRQIVSLKLENDDPVPMARLLSYVAYPAPEQEPERVQFEHSLCWAILIWRTDTEPGWVHNIRSIAKWLMVDPNTEMAHFKKGYELLVRRMVVSTFFLRAFFVDGAPLKKPLKLSQILPWFPDIAHWEQATVENMASVYGQFAKKGRKPINISNVKTDHWGPTKPVIHVAYSLVDWLTFDHRFTIVNPKGLPDRKLEFILYRSFFRSVDLAFWLEYAERIRQALPNMAKPSKFKIREDETIQFVAE